MAESDDLHARLNGETGRISWQELQRHFARGVVIHVSADLDLVEVAAHVARDDRAAVEGWITEGKIARATSDHAEEWERRKPDFWAVVTAPWVLVQEASERPARLH